MERCNGQKFFKCPECGGPDGDAMCGECKKCENEMCVAYRPVSSDAAVTIT